MHKVNVSIKFDRAKSPPFSNKGIKLEICGKSSNIWKIKEKIKFKHTPGWVCIIEHAYNPTLRTLNREHHKLENRFSS